MNLSSAFEWQQVNQNQHEFVIRNASVRVPGIIVFGKSEVWFTDYFGKIEHSKSKTAEETKNEAVKRFLANAYR